MCPSLQGACPTVLVLSGPRLLGQAHPMTTTLPQCLVPLPPCLPSQARCQRLKPSSTTVALWAPPTLLLRPLSLLSSSEGHSVCLLQHWEQNQVKRLILCIVTVPGRRGWPCVEVSVLSECPMSPRFSGPPRGHGMFIRCVHSQVPQIHSQCQASATPGDR